MKYTTIPLRAALMGLALGLGGIATAAPEADAPAQPMQKTMRQRNPLRNVTQLVADIHGTSGSDVKGTVTFTKAGSAVEISVKIGGLKPNSEHAFHVHEFGNASSDDGSSAGGHYNPEGHDHGLPDAKDRHAGDLGNLKADDDGNAVKTMTVDNITLAGAHNPIIGRSVVVHAGTDDGGQPVGNAGGRIGMGVIGVSKVSAAGDMQPNRRQARQNRQNPPATTAAGGTKTEVQTEPEMKAHAHPSGKVEVEVTPPAKK